MLYVQFAVYFNKFLIIFLLAGIFVQGSYPKIFMFPGGFSFANAMTFYFLLFFDFVIWFYVSQN